MAEDDPPEPLSDRRPRGHRAGNRRSRRVRAPRRLHRSQRQGQGPAQGARCRLRQGPRTRRGGKGDHLHRVPQDAELPAAPVRRQSRGPRASCSSTAPTPTIRSKAIYAAGWSAIRASTEITGSRTADMRSALVDYFREQGRIMIATEAGAEGINLQFCSLVVNYDLPWNPAAHRAAHRPLPPLRPEARRGGRQLPQPEERGRPARVPTSRREIPALRGRLRRQRRGARRHRIRRGLRETHRRHLPATAASRRRSRPPSTNSSSNSSFEINEAMTATRRKLLENFDDEVREKLKVRDEASQCLPQPL